MRNTPFIFTALLALATACANQTSPMGGPKDETPPQLVASGPGPNQKNFRGQEFNFIFDEYVALNNPNEEIIVTPSIGKRPKITVKKKTVTIIPETPLLENTTYTINFREGVQDITERNRPDNLRIAFSTGPTIDSLSISGTVRDLFKDEIPQNITVAIFASDTFNIYRHPALFFTKTNKSGSFSITNLKPGRYFLYAFQDKNKNLIVDRSEKHGFNLEPINLEDDTKDVTIAILNIDPRKPQVTALRHGESQTTVRFNKAISQPRASTPGQRLQYTFGDNTTEVLIAHPATLKDSIPVRISAQDSLRNSLDTTLYIKPGKARFVDTGFKVTTTDGRTNQALRQIHRQISATKPLTSIRTDSIFLELDSTKRTPATLLKYDTLSKIAQLLISYPDTLKPGKYALRYTKGAFISSTQDSSAARTEPITLLKAEDLSTLTVDITTKTPHFIVELLTHDYKLVDRIANKTKHTFTQITPADYRLRIIIDTNANGQWDAGNFEARESHEHVLFHQTIDEGTKFPVRANWEVELKVTF